jgi:hypothetical protein
MLDGYWSTQSTKASIKKKISTPSVHIIKEECQFHKDERKSYPVQEQKSIQIDMSKL